MAFDSLFTGISGLNAYQSWIDMLSNNIANTATTGFKGQRMTFADMFYQQTGRTIGPDASATAASTRSTSVSASKSTASTRSSRKADSKRPASTPTSRSTATDSSCCAHPTVRRSRSTRATARSRSTRKACSTIRLRVSRCRATWPNSNGDITQNGTLGNITIPIGLTEQATATGQGVKIGPTTNDKVFDMSLGGNLDQTQWSQQFLNTIGASINPGTPKTISTTIYDSLGNAHQAHDHVHAGCDRLNLCGSRGSAHERGPRRRRQSHQQRGDGCSADDERSAEQDHRYGERGRRHGDGDRPIRQQRYGQPGFERYA